MSTLAPRFARAVVSCALGLWSALLTGPPTSAAQKKVEGTSISDSTDRSASQAPRISLLATTSGTVSPGSSSSEFTLQIDNLAAFSPTAVTALEVVATVHQRVRTITEFRGATTSKDLGVVLGLVRAPGFSAQEAASPTLIRTLRISLTRATNTCSDCIFTDTDGVYPVEFTLRKAGGDRIFDSFTSFVVERQQPTTPMKVALIVPIHSKPSLAALGRSFAVGQDLTTLLANESANPSKGQLVAGPASGNGSGFDGPESGSEAGSGDFVAMTEALASQPDVALTVWPTPESLDQNTQLLDTLRGALRGREIVSKPYVNIDFDSLAESKLSGEIERLWKAGTTTIRDRLAPGADTSTMIADHVVSDTILDQLGIKRLVTPSSSIQGLAEVVPLHPILVDPGARSGHATAARPALVWDSAVQQLFVEHVTDHPAGFDDVLRAQNLEAALNLVDILELSSPTVPASTFPPGSVPQPDPRPTDADRGMALPVAAGTTQATLDALLKSLASSQFLKPSTLDEVFALPTRAIVANALSVPTKVKSAPAEYDEVAATFQKITETRLGYSSLFGSGTLSTGSFGSSSRTTGSTSGAGSASGGRSPSLASQLQFLTAANNSLLSADMTPESRRSSLALASNIVDSRIGLISNQTSKHLTLTAQAQPIPISLVNSTGSPIKVVLKIETDTAQLPEAQAGRESRGKQSLTKMIEMTGRVQRESVVVASKGPGRFSMLMTLSSPDGFVLSRTRYSLRATRIGGWGKGLTIGSLAILAIWWIRTTRKRRKSQSK